MPDEPAEPPQSPEEDLFAKLLEGRLFYQGPDPEACPQCRSTDFAPIERPPPRVWTDDGTEPFPNLMYCGHCMDHDRWECRSCGHRWHEEPPRMSDEERERKQAEWQAERIEESLKKYARFTALAKEPPKDPTAFVDRVLRLTSSPENRSFGVRFSWGRVIVEKTTGLVDEGGAPEFRCAGPGSRWAPAGWDAEAEAIAVVLRHVERFGDAPYIALRSESRLR